MADVSTIKSNMKSVIDKFYGQTFHYPDNDNLWNDMKYLYSMEEEIDTLDESNIDNFYEKLRARIDIIQLKYGFDKIVIDNNPELGNLKNFLDGISLDSDTIIDDSKKAYNEYNRSLSTIKNLDFIKNRYENIQGKEGLYLTVESLKSLISNEKYRKNIEPNQINDIIVDCIKINEGITPIEKITSKYKDLMNKIWGQSLTDKVDENGNFRMLYSCISGGGLIEQANNMLNRPEQASCSMISSDFIATYGSSSQRIGFIYPSNSDIMTYSAYDLCSNVFGGGSINKEMGSSIATPEVLDRIGKQRAQSKGEDFYSSSCYNEILVNAKPCGILILGLGDYDINIDIESAKLLSERMNLPIQYIDTTKYKDKLSEKDKEYIAFHSLSSYMGMTMYDHIEKSKYNNGFSEFYKTMDQYKEPLSETFLSLKKEGQLNKDNMCQAMNNIVDISLLDSLNKGTSL